MKNCPVQLKPARFIGTVKNRPVQLVFTCPIALGMKMDGNEWENHSMLPFLYCITRNGSRSGIIGNVSETGCTGNGNGREPKNLSEDIIVHLLCMNITQHTRKLSFLKNMIKASCFLWLNVKCIDQCCGTKEDIWCV